LAPLIAKSSWLPATHQDLQGRLKTSTLKTSPPTSCLLTHLQTRCPPTETLDASVTGSATNGAGGSGTTSPSATLRKLSRRSKAECTLPPSSASCRSQRSHARLREFAPERSSPSSLKALTSCGSTTGSTSLLPPGTATTKLQVAAPTPAPTVLELSSQLSPTVLAQTLVDPHRVVTATARLSLTALTTAAAVTLTVAAATTGAPTTEPTGGQQRQQPRRSRPREQPRLRRLTGRLRRPPED
jgi:hypothetical protein